jgi:predicted esterase
MNTIYSNGECKYDIVLGHSQGAILTAALLSTHDNLWSGSMRPKGFIFNGVAWPNPFNDPMQSLPKRILHDPLNNSHLPMMLFIMGLADDINPVESAKQVSDIYNNARFSVSVVEHSGGHSVPYKDDDDSQRALNEVVDWIINTTQQN